MYLSESLHQAKVYLPSEVRDALGKKIETTWKAKRNGPNFTDGCIRQLVDGLRMRGFGPSNLETIAYNLDLAIETKKEQCGFDTHFLEWAREEIRLQFVANKQE